MSATFADLEGDRVRLDPTSALGPRPEDALIVPESMELRQAFAGVVQRLRAADAAVDGVAVGAGMAPALADVRFAAPSATFHIGAVKIGITAGECGISSHLPRLIGAGRDFELMLAGRPIGSDEALQIGLISAVVPREDLLARAFDCVNQIMANSRYSTAHTKRVMWKNLDCASLDAAIELENHAQVLGLMTNDFRELQALSGIKESRT